MVKDLFGHRGAAYEAPENTLAGFSYAWKIGVRSFEVDVRLSADQQLIILHDESLQRTTGVARKVGELTAARLAELNAMGLRIDFSNFYEFLRVSVVLGAVWKEQPDSFAA